ncbi:protein CIA1-like isoform X4 [Solanum dulcamara]|uniref:protein CIA1-like isoform X4 n=1 Tax=Solanum dulcamara TaxID=45834 RepID=UPI00248661B4|nr:protein CIA1-like isoform X4 [Solanum dulcamara]
MIKPYESGNRISPGFSCVSDDLTMEIWSCETERTVEIWELHHAPLNEAENPEIFASVGADDAVRVFIENKDNEVDELTFKLLLKKEKAHEMNVNSLKCHAGDKRFLASASDDGTEKIWEFVCPSPQWQG